MARVPSSNGRKPTKASREAHTSLLLSTANLVPPGWQDLAAQYRFARNLARANAGTQFAARYQTRLANMELQIGDRLNEFLSLVEAAPRRSVYYGKDYKNQ